MNSTDKQSAEERPPDGNRKFLISLGRAFGGAILFTVPMLMTMEIWQLGFYMPRPRLVLFILLAIPLLTGLSHFVGFETNHHLTDIILDPFVAFAVGFLTAGAVLFLFSVLEAGMSADEIVGKVSLQAIPASIGAMLARGQLGVSQEDEVEKRTDESLLRGLFLMAVGAIFLSFSLSPTEEMILIAFQMTAWHAVGLAIASLATIHAFVSFKPPHGRDEQQRREPFWSVFLRVTVTGYAVALVVSLYVLWTFDRTSGMAFGQILSAVIVTGFPASVGAGAARLIL